jgi:hypothetical protein
VWDSGRLRNVSSRDSFEADQWPVWAFSGTKKKSVYEQPGVNGSDPPLAPSSSSSSSSSTSCHHRAGTDSEIYQGLPKRLKKECAPRAIPGKKRDIRKLGSKNLSKG